MTLLHDEEIKEVFERFKKENPNPTSELKWTNSFTLLVSVVLSAQATDKSVNKVTESLYKIADTPQKILSLGEVNLISYIKSIGLYKSKAKHIIELSKMLIEQFNSQVPDNLEDLIKLPGVGRKTANVVLLEVFGIANGIAVDTHAKRISNKLGLSSNSDPEKIEQDLLKIFDKEDLKFINHLLVWHGRNYCKAQKPDCENCTINKFCKTFLANK